MREIYSFNDDWVFSKTSERPLTFPSLWEKVTLPHTWNSEDGQDGGNDYWRGKATYAKSFGYPRIEDGSQVYLEFKAVAMTAEVFLNGRHVASHRGGFSLFRVDIKH